MVFFTLYPLSQGQLHSTIPPSWRESKRYLNNAYSVIRVGIQSIQLGYCGRSNGLQ